MATPTTRPAEGRAQGRALLLDVRARISALMKITQDVSDYAAEHGVDEAKALKPGWRRNPPSSARRRGGLSRGLRHRSPRAGVRPAPFCTGTRCAIAWAHVERRRPRVPVPRCAPAHRRMHRRRAAPGGRLTGAAAPTRSRSRPCRSCWCWWGRRSRGVARASAGHGPGRHLPTLDVVTQAIATLRRAFADHAHAPSASKPSRSRDTCSSPARNGCRRRRPWCRRPQRRGCRHRCLGGIPADGAGWRPCSASPPSGGGQRQCRIRGSRHGRRGVATNGRSDRAPCADVDRR